MKVTDYSVIIFRKDGSFTYETIKSTEGCGNVLLATHICTPEVNDLTDVNDFIAFKDILNSYMTICDDKCVKCRWLDRSKFLFMDSNESHYNFYFEE